MSEIDKKIKKIETWIIDTRCKDQEIQPCERKWNSEWYRGKMGKAFSLLRELIDQLRECREELWQWDIAAKDGHSE